MIIDLPPPSALAVPLPAGARIAAARGARVRAGQTLAAGADGTAVIAPLSGRVGDFVMRPAAGGGAARCLRLSETENETPQRVAANGDFLMTLRQSGIIGLGGGAFPARQKWRPRLRLFIANAVQSAPLAHCDHALLKAAGDDAVRRVLAVGRRFAGEAVLAVGDDYAAALPAHAAVRRVAAGYAAGSERLLIESITGVRLSGEQTPSDYGIVCFNIATVFAMADALAAGAPLRGRVITAHDGARALNLRVPFGACVDDIRRFVRPAAAAALCNGRAAPPEAVITAAALALQFARAKPPPAPAPCIRCAACDAACPVALSPMTLHRLARDLRRDDMRDERIGDCLECRRCDEVCPSNIPLTAQFHAHKKTIAAQAAEQRRRARWRDLHDARRRRLRRDIPRADIAALKRETADIVRRAAADK